MKCFCLLEGYRKRQRLFVCLFFSPKAMWISKTMKSVSSNIQTLRLEKRGASRVFFNQLRSVLISDETLFRVFDIASQSINNSRRNSTKSSHNLMIIRITYPNLLYGSDFLCFLFMNYLSIWESSRRHLETFNESGVHPVLWTLWMTSKSIERVR